MTLIAEYPRKFLEFKFTIASQTNISSKHESRILNEQR